MSMRRVNPNTLPPPIGYTYAVTANGGTQVFLAGHTAHGGDGRVAGEGVAGQFERALSNLLTTLAAAGGRPGNLAKLTVYVTDIDDYKAHRREIGEVWQRLAGREYPAMALLEVSRLWDVDATIELEGIAVLP